VRAVELAIRATLDLLELFPASGRALRQRPEVRVMPTRRFPLLIFYKNSANELLILHIRHAARRPLSTDDTA
jgi:plasmid stabilization system protein ParE